MQSHEVRATGRAVGTVLAEGIGLIRHLHFAIADRAFGAPATTAGSARARHDRIADLVYRPIISANRWAPRVAAAVAAPALSGAPALGSSGRGNVAIGAVNGLWGDRLAAAGNELTISMAVRHRREDLPLTSDHMAAAAFPSASPRIALFVHGLCETEDAWVPSPRRAERGKIQFGQHLADDAGCTPVYVRYNSGLHISDNGAALSALLDDLVAVWPVPVTNLVLIGHSMGGLVIRSACHDGLSRSAAWIADVHDVVFLGTPHLGAPLERGVNVMSWLLARIPETTGLGRVLDARSVGIKDLRYGTVNADDWRDIDLDGLLTGRAEQEPLLPGVRYSCIGVTISADRNHPAGRVLGDLLVQYPSASGHGRRRRMGFDVDRQHHLGGLNHFDLLTHPDVYAQVRRCLEP